MKRSALKFTEMTDLTPLMRVFHEDGQFHAKCHSCEFVN